MSTTTDKPTVESDAEMSVWAITERQRFRKASNLKRLPYIADIDFLLAELDQIEAKHESELDDACAEMGEIRGCDKCDLCEDHHG